MHCRATIANCGARPTQSELGLIPVRVHRHLEASRLLWRVNTFCFLIAPSKRRSAFYEFHCRLLHRHAAPLSAATHTPPSAINIIFSKRSDLWRGALAVCGMKVDKNNRKPVTRVQWLIKAETLLREMKEDWIHLDAYCLYMPPILSSVLLSIGPTMYASAYSAH